jgi:hypothetical protein
MSPGVAKEGFERPIPKTARMSIRARETCVSPTSSGYERVQVLRLRSASTAPTAMHPAPNTTGAVGLLPVRGRLPLAPPGATVVTACWVTDELSVVVVTMVVPRPEFGVVSSVLVVAASVVVGASVDVVVSGSEIVVEPPTAEVGGTAVVVVVAPCSVVVVAPSSVVVVAPPVVVVAAAVVVVAASVVVVGASVVLGARVVLGAVVDDAVVLGGRVVAVVVVVPPLLQSWISGTVVLMKWFAPSSHVP